jgi:demethylmenaquinone methyltransferase/2-methoxy-6-polyprenyl-1,4-benzoquinol methylase
MPRKKLAPHPVLSDYYENEAERQEKVDYLFDTSASHYDWITDVMSFGSGRWYRNDALRRAGCMPGHKVLDVGAGTGVITLLAQNIVGEEGEAIALDPSGGMLREARKQGVRKATKGVGESLPFPDDHFDLLTMGYALRHVADLHTAFREYRRVLKPGGKVLLLEISRPESRLATRLLKFYLKGIVPNIARVFRRSTNAKVLMQYYWDTIEACVLPGKIVQALQDAGFSESGRHVVLGIFSEYTGIKAR